MVSSDYVWTIMCDVFGIASDLAVTDFKLHLPANGVAVITMDIIPDYNLKNGLSATRHRFNLVDCGEPSWMHASLVIASEAKAEIQSMVDSFTSHL